MIKIPFRLKYWLLPLFLLPLLLTGCGDMVEIQERDFVMALGLAYDDDYRITFALPNLDAITGQSADGESGNFIRTFAGTSYPEIEAAYNQNSQNRLDLRHLKAIVFDASIGSKPDRMKGILDFLNENYELSHNVLVFYSSNDVNGLMEMEGILGSSIGDYLQNLNKNNKRHGIQNVTIGHLITAQENNRTVAVPALNHDDRSVYLKGCVLFQNNQIVRQLDQEERELLHIMLGEGNDYLFHLSNQTVVRINQVNSKLEYHVSQNQPYVRLIIKGAGEAMPATRSSGDPQLAQQLNHSVSELLETQMLPIILEEQVDFLNLYEKSSYMQKNIWLEYQDNHEDFLSDLMLEIQIDFTIE